MSAPLAQELAHAVAVAGPDVSGVLDVAAADWRAAVTALRGSGASWFDLLTAYDELDDGFAVVLRVARPGGDAVLLRTRVPRERPVLASVADLYPGAAWHEREVREMFGIEVEGLTDQRPLLLGAGAPAHPLRKETPLRARVETTWPGATDPSGRPPRRRQLPPGVAAAWVDGDAT
jgi:NADH-quinone oxidoreductase subunit C